MKKLFSLMLVAMMLLTTLTGCNVLVTLQNLLDPTVPSATSPTTDTSTASSTTVTREEFLAAMECTNFTSSAANTTQQQFWKCTETAMHFTDLVNQVVQYEAYFGTVDNEKYLISKNGDKYIAIKQDYPTIIFGDYIVSLWEFEDCNAVFDSLVYDEANKSYKCEHEKLTMDIRFENGKIKSVHAVMTLTSSVVTYDFYDFGTTVIELPEYTLASADSQ